MDDARFQAWSDNLAELRRSRQASWNGKMEKSHAVPADDFLGTAKDSVDKILGKWLSFEQESLHADPPPDLPGALEAIRGELGSILEFELDAVKRDLDSLRAQMPSGPPLSAEVEEKLDAAAAELRKKYELKIAALSSPGKNKPETKYAPERKQMSYSGASGSSRIGVFTMFLVGLLLGAGPGVYFWDLSKKADKKVSEDRSRLTVERKELEDKLTIVHDSFIQLATGKKKNLPELEREEKQIIASFAARRAETERAFSRRRAALLKKIPAGTRQDEALQDWAEDKEEELKRLKAKETAALDPVVRAKTALRELLGR